MGGSLHSTQQVDREALTRMAQPDRSDVLASAAGGDEIAHQLLMVEDHDDMRGVCSYVTRDIAVAEELARPRGLRVGEHGEVARVVRIGTLPRVSQPGDDGHLTDLARLYERAAPGHDSALGRHALLRGAPQCSSLMLWCSHEDDDPYR